MNWRAILKTDLGAWLFGGRRKRPSWQGPRYWRSGRRRKDLLKVIAQLASIVRANAPLAGGLQAAALDAPGSGMQAILERLHDTIEAGDSLSAAMRRLPRFFPSYYAELVEAGEHSGRLGESLDELADEVTRRMTLSQSVAGWLGYLFTVLFIQCLLALFTCTRTAPVFAQMLQEVGTRVPGKLQFLLDAGARFRYLAARPALLICLATAGIILAIPCKSIRGRSVIRHGLLAVGMLVPFLRGMVIKRDLCRVASVMEKLVRAGVPVDRALTSAMDLDIMPRHARGLERVRTSVRAGQSVYAAFESNMPSLPRAFSALVGLGERSGQLDEGFRRIADLYERDVAKAQRILIDTVMPLGVFGLGCISLIVTAGIFEFMTTILDWMM